MKNVLIIGAGKRIREDVLPVFLKLPHIYNINKIYARSTKTLSVSNKNFNVSNIDDLSQFDIDNAGVIYVAVPVSAYAEVFSLLSGFNCTHITLFIDTPTANGLHTKNFKKVLVAEDSIALPWLDLFQDKQIKRVVAKKSFYRYHGIAILKKLFGKNPLAGFCFFNYVILWFGGTYFALIVEPRDYSSGDISICTDSGVYSARQNTYSKNILMVLYDNMCTAFSDGTNIYTISIQESELIGYVAPTDNMVTKMLAIKRVGLYRMLSGRNLAWSYDDGLNDNTIDRLLHRVGLFIWF